MASHRRALVPSSSSLRRELLASSRVAALLVIPFMRKPSDEDPALYRAMFDQAPDARFVLDGQGHILHANPPAVQMFGVVELTLRDVAFTDLLAPASRPKFTQALGLVRSIPSRAGPLELEGRTTNGSFFPIEIDLVRGSEERYGLVVRNLRATVGVRRPPVAPFNPGQTLIASRIGELV